MPVASISRQFARWAATTTFDDLPSEVVAKIKSLILLHLVAGLHGQADEHGTALVRQIEVEEHHPGGASVFGRSVPVTRGGAVFANCELFHCAGLYDSYRMLTHPGPSLIAAALTNAELSGKGMRDVITALAVGYEFECRLAHDFIPTVSAHGFRPSPVFSTMGAAMVSGKLLDLDEDGLVAAIAIAANCAGGLNEDGRAGGGERVIHEAVAARQGTFAAMTAALGDIKGSETVIEGDAGFLNGFAGSRDGRLSYVFDGPLSLDLASLTDGLGRDYRLLQVMYRLYACSGYNQGPIELIRAMKQKYELSATDVRSVTIRLNYLETLYPSPAFPKIANVSAPRIGSTPYYVAHVLLSGDYPIVGQSRAGIASDTTILDYLTRFTLIGVHGQPMFSPTIEVETLDGHMYTDSLDYADMLWTFDVLAERLRGGADGLPGGEETLDEVVDLVRRAEKLDSVEPVFALARSRARR
ncbi:MmgE/PrpD family protein [Nocardia miyunensis]|uniref:MmgE/PrpD family protein n=1 Tax=Nocardia miyunensis TaxID=282684 RepID=UPI0008302FC5|nr:MmgE/PrpD family protein [Nocardia miyunensis]